MRTVNFKNVLQINEIYEGDNNVYCLGSLYTGPSLFTLIKDKSVKITDQLIFLVMVKMIRVLAYFERKSIIHRDLKPENIVFADKDNLNDPVLVDLGFATHESEYDKLFQRCGTPGHVAPEVLSDKPYGCKADVFSLGVGNPGLTYRSCST